MLTNTKINMKEKQFASIGLERGGNWDELFRLRHKRVGANFIKESNRSLEV